MDAVDLGTFARAWSVQTNALAWLLGAGTSAAAAVPTAGQIVDDLLVRLYASDFKLVRQAIDVTDPAILARVHAHYDGIAGAPKLGTAGDYSAVLETVLPDENARRAYLQQMLHGRVPSYGQRVLGALFSADKARLALTTNFDQLVEMAAADAHGHATNSPVLHVAALGSTDRATRTLADETWPLLVKLHGDFGESRLKNLSNELQRQDAVLRQAVGDASRRFGLVVVGYSGRDASVMEMLREALTQTGAWPHGIWWLAREPDGLLPAVRSFLDEADHSGVGVNVVHVENFDEAMGALAAQSELSDPLREFVDAMSPGGVVSPAPFPRGEAPAFPVLRLNALPILSAPARAWRAAVQPNLKAEDFRRRLRAGGWRGAAVLGPGEVMAFGRESLLVSCLDLPDGPRQVDIDMLDPGAPPHLRALGLEALTRGIARRVPARPVVREGESSTRLVLVPPHDNEHSRDARTRAELQAAYPDSIIGKVPTKFGRNADGEARDFSEGLRLRLEFAADTWWLLFLPFTWVQRDGRVATIAAAGPGPADPAAAWMRERWTQRRRNEAWAKIIDAWANALAGPDDATTVWVLRRADADEADAVGGLFELGAKTAWSKEVRM